VNWGALLCLPFVLRALIPIGFMPMFGPGFGMRLVICEGYAPGAPSSAAPMSMDMSGDMAAAPADMPMDGPLDARDLHGGRSPRADHETCPYGASPTLGAPPTLSGVARSLERASEPAMGVSQLAFFELLPRAQSARDPPALS
jgi:hypothetical protein